MDDPDFFDFMIEGGDELLNSEAWHCYFSKLNFMEENIIKAFIAENQTTIYKNRRIYN